MLCCSQCYLSGLQLHIILQCAGEAEFQLDKCRIVYYKKFFLLCIASCLVVCTSPRCCICCIMQVLESVCKP